MNDAAALLPHLATYPISEAVFENFELPADDVLEGDPRTEVAVYFQSEDGSVLVGASRFTQGTVRYRQTADEVNYVTKGRMTITSDQDNTEIVCEAGSVTKLDKGAVYTKIIHEPYEEIYVMLNEGGVHM